MEEHGGRRPGSRKNRPCDLCRVRKVACKIASRPPCEFCVSKSHPCTFDQRSGPRKRRQVDNPPQVTDHVGHDDFRQQQEENSPGYHDHLPARPSTPGPDFTAIDPSLDLSHSWNTIESGVEGFLLWGSQFASSQPRIKLPYAPTPTRTEGNTVDQYQRQLELPWPPPHAAIPARGNLDKHASLVDEPVVYVGPSGDLDPALLAHRYYDDQNVSISQYTKARYHRMRPLIDSTGSLTPPAVFTSTGIPSISRTNSSGSEELNGIRESFEERIDSVTASGLLALYLRFVHPYFPIISRRQLPSEDCVFNLPVSLLSAICATAIPFVLYDDALCVEASRLPTQEDFFRIARQALLDEEEAGPSLSTFQTYLLLLQRTSGPKGQPNEAATWSLCCQMVSLAQILGLNEDPSEWTALPPWERCLRKRLWWAGWTTEKWMAFGQGMPSHLHHQGSNVCALARSDLADCADNDRDINPYFLSLVQLTYILDDIMETMFTIEATAHSMESVEGLLQAARTFRERLREWHRGVPKELTDDSWRIGMNHYPGRSTLSSNELNGNASLRIAFFATQLAIFRALIRPISMSALYATRYPAEFVTSVASSLKQDFMSATMQGAASALRDLINFVERLTMAEWDAFWPGWSRHNFALASTLLMHCYLLVGSAKTQDDSMSPQEQNAHPSPTQVLGSLLSDTDRNSILSVLPSIQTDIQLLAQKWRWVLRLAARGAAGKKHLTDLSLLRIDALFTEWNRAQLRRPTLTSEDVG